MSLSLIVAMTPERVIGRDNQLPWHIPADLKRFKKITMGHPIIMGRKTFESIGRPLPGRQNVVVTRQSPYRSEGIVVAHSLNDAIEKCDSTTGEEFVIGGEQLFQEALPRVKKIYLTLVMENIAGNVFFPEFDETQFRWTTPIVDAPSETSPLPTQYMEGSRQ